MKSPELDREAVFTAVRALADDAGRVSDFAPRLAREFGCTPGAISRLVRAYGSDAALAYLGKGLYRLTDIQLPEPPKPQPSPVRNDIVSFRSVSLARVRWLDKAVPQ